VFGISSKSALVYQAVGAASNYSKCVEFKISRSRDTASASLHEEIPRPISRDMADISEADILRYRDTASASLWHSLPALPSTKAANLLEIPDTNLP